jgi:hypothetical protein
MISGLFGQGTVTNTLRGGLAEASATHKVIAERVANAQQQSATIDFSGQLDAKLAMEEDIERDMTSLADTQLRYDATAKLLQTSYAEYRSAIRNG